MAKVKYYGVKRGLVPGVYTSWDEKHKLMGFLVLNISHLRQKKKRMIM